MKFTNILTRPLAVVLAIGLGSTGYSEPSLEPVLVTVQPQIRHQTVEGFGVSISAWIEANQKWFQDPELADYATNELGMSIFRLQMWGGVMPDEVKDWRDIDYRNFDWDGGGSIRGRLNRDWAKLASEANSELRVIGSVWSAPGWMKENGQRTGTKAGFLLNPDRDYDHDNRLREDRYMHFAKWVVEFAKAMEAQGTPFYAISLQNELLFTQSFESTMYGADEYARIVQVTGEMFEREGVRKPLFYGPEDMTVATYEDKVRHKPHVDALMNTEAHRYFDVFATHGYSDGVRSDSRFNMEQYWNGIAPFGRPYWITEGGSGSHDWPDVVVGGIASRLHLALVDANVSLFTGWQLVGRGANEHQFMVKAKPTKKTFAAMHYWRHIRPGANRVDVVDSGEENLLVSAFVHDEKQKSTTVLLNTSTRDREVLVNWGRYHNSIDWKAWQTNESYDHREVDLVTDSKMVRLNLPGPSITTVVSDWDRTWHEPLRKPRWRRDIQQVVAQEDETPVPENGILFVGSSSIRLWESLKSDFPGKPVYNRGFGGSQVSDLIGYFDEVIAAGDPRQIVIYSGTNDLNAGESPEHVMSDFDNLLKMIDQRLPGAKVALIGAAPNPHRWPSASVYQRFNAMMAHYCERQGHEYVDVWSGMIGSDGLPSRDLYRDDQLHMNANGYEIWRGIIAPILD